MFVIGNNVSDLNNFVSVIGMAFLRQNYRHTDYHLNITGNYYVIPVIDYLGEKNRFLGSKTEITSVMVMMGIEPKNLIYL